MKIVHSIAELNDYLNPQKSEGRSVGFVPTMGALHEGHMRLVQQAKASSDVVVVSIFVNPTQFNNPEDLRKYPRTPENDIALLSENACDCVFFPAVDEMYPANWEAPEVPLGKLDRLMEGAFRPGHFNGVVQIVYRLFELVQPHKAFFGLKDFQQVAVIQHMVRYLNLPYEIVTCPTARSADGLALSSRNMRLNDQEKMDALHIYRTMVYAQSLYPDHSPSTAQKMAVEFFNHGFLKLEYLQIVHPATLEELLDEWVEGATICIACFCGDVRLIDNMTLVAQK